MTTVFIAGSMNIKRLDRKVKERIAKIVTSNLSVVVGDADGADTSIQTYLFEHGADNTVVYCSGSRPRNNVGDWPVHSVVSNHRSGSRAFFAAKDVEMAKAADCGLMIWDAKSTGTLSNVIELLKRKKKTVVFINKSKEFRTIKDVSHLEELVMYMSEHARRKADEKIHVLDKINALKTEQFQMFD
jgi:hypothetical protein